MRGRLVWHEGFWALRDVAFMVGSGESVGIVGLNGAGAGQLKGLQEAGSTILFVSHDPTPVKTLCQRPSSDEGRPIQEGPPDQVMDCYSALIARREARRAILQSETESGRMTTRSGTFEVRITEINLLDADGRPVRAFTVGDHWRPRGTASSSCRRSSRRRPGS